MKFILQRVPKERQFLVFSATLNIDVLNTAYQFGANPHEVNVSRDQAKAENVEDKIFHVGQGEKGSHLLSLLRLHKPRQAIIFSNFKMNVPRISQFLNDNSIPTVGISSLLTQSQRNRVMEQFKGESDHNVLVATDVAARGLDIKGVDMVVNFELPDDPENYVHRIGRTGRAGAKGLAFSLVSDRDVDALSRVEQYLKHKVDIGYLEEGDLVKEYKAMPSERSSRGERSPRPQSGGSERGSRRAAPGGRGRTGGAEGEAPAERAPKPRPEGRSTGEGPQAIAAGAARPPRDPARAKADGQSGRTPRGGRDRQSRTPQVAGQPGAVSRPTAPGTAGAGAASGSRPGGRGQGRRDQAAGAQAGRGGPQTRGQAGRNGGPGGRGKDGAGPKSGPGKSPVGQASLGKKVSGFFKRLFGG
jgi:ATP-dependent RNA helicase RhlE